MEAREINILGTEYKVIMSNPNEDPYLEDMDGYCDETTKTIVIDNIISGVHSKHDLKDYINKNIRHEIIHAFLFESGLANESSWALNEEMIDWFARQFPKIQKVFKDLNVLKEEINNVLN